MKPISNEDVSQQLEAGKEEDACSLKKRKNSDDKTFDINKTVKRLRLYVAKTLVHQNDMNIQNFSLSCLYCTNCFKIHTYFIFIICF